MSAPLSQVPPPRRYIRRTIPSVAQLHAIPLAASGEFELSDREVAQTRRLIYSINKQHIFRYRTMRDGIYLQVWRIR